MECFLLELLRYIKKVEKRGGDTRSKKYEMKRLAMKEFIEQLSKKNLVLPKIPDQAIYYSRQLYMYNFTICLGTSHDHQTKDNTFMYVWLEFCRPKGSNEIASAVYDRLKKLDLSGITKLKLVADSCGGQNKNSTIIGMIFYWLRNESPQTIEEVELVFANRIFGRIEKETKKLDTIIKPEDYCNIFNNYGTIIKLGTDCRVYDWKANIPFSNHQVAGISN
ncbi:hypothetical protein C0J52_02553 [Blattella germanica]|nr:hypothetical protein C0J52_02553 [Blattella germanica]